MTSFDQLSVSAGCQNVNRSYISACWAASVNQQTRVSSSVSECQPVYCSVRVPARYQATSFTPACCALSLTLVLAAIFQDWYCQTLIVLLLLLPSSVFSPRRQQQLETAACFLSISHLSICKHSWRCWTILQVIA